MISQIASAPLQSVIRIEAQNRSPDNRPSIDRTAPPADPAHANAHTSRQAKLAALQSSLQDIVIRRDSASQLRSAYSEMAPHLDRMKQLAQMRQADSGSKSAIDSEFDIRRTAIRKLSGAIGDYQTALPDLPKAPKLAIDRIDISTPAGAMTASDTLDMALSALEGLDISLDAHERELAAQADSMTSLSGRHTSADELKQREKQTETANNPDQSGTSQMATRSALLKQMASASLDGFAGYSGLLPILSD